MRIPVEAYAPMLHEESMLIAGRNAEPVFETIPIVDIPEDTVATTVIPVSLVNTHVVPNQTVPRLGKLEFKNEAIPSDVSAFAIDYCMNYIKSTQPIVNYDQLRVTADAIKRVCETIDDEASPLSRPAQTLGVFAVYITDAGEPIAQEYLSTSFVSRLACELPEIDVPDPESQEFEDGLRLAYATQTEHKEMVSFDEWLEENKKFLIESGEDIRKDMAKGYLGMLLFPAQNTHPTLDIELFSQRPQVT